MESWRKQLQQKMVVPQAQQGKTEDSRSDASRGVLQRAAGVVKGKGTARPATAGSSTGGSGQPQHKRKGEQVMEVRRAAGKKQAPMEVVKEKGARPVEIRQNSSKVPAVVDKAGYKRKEATKPSVLMMRADMPATTAQKTKAMEEKKKPGLEVEKAAVKVVSIKEEEQEYENDEEEQEDENDEEEEDEEEEEEEEEEDDEDWEEEGEDSSNEYYDEEEEEGDNIDEYEEEEPLVPRHWQQQPDPLVMADEVVAQENSALHEHQVKEEVVNDEPMVVVKEPNQGHGNEDTTPRFRNFEGGRILAQVERTEDNGVASRTRRCKVLQRQNSQLVIYDKTSKGTSAIR